MRSLSFKFILILIFVSLLGIGFVVIYAGQVIKEEFTSYLFRQDQEQLLGDLVDLYEAHDGWPNISYRQLRSLDGGGPRLWAVADTDGYIVVSSPVYSMGDKLSQTDLSLGLPLEIQGEVVGTAIPPFSRSGFFTPIIDNFTETINRSLLLGAIIAVSASVLVGLLFSLTLTRRLTELVKAAQAIAKGKLNRKVPVRTKDEIGELASAFNQMSTDLERSRELRHQLTADIAHELRTPLSIILGRAETLAEGMLPPTQEVFRILHEEAQWLNRLVEDLRTLSLSDAGELSIEKRSVTIHQLLDDVYNIYVDSAGQQGIALGVKCAEDMPFILADPDRLKQVLANLLNNAIQHTHRGGQITLSASELDNEIMISVRDNGSGISEKELPFLFDRFYREDKSRNRENGGSGLGLAIAKALVDAHNGRIDVWSPPGAGTTFSMWLPIYEETKVNPGAG